MPNSAWTISGNTVTVSVTASSIDNSSASVDYLSNADKISLLAQYASELSTKSSLDTTAASLSCSTTAYDAAVAAINTTLVNAGASSTWATTWPDGTIFGPVVGIKTLLAQDWATVATTRTALQSAISATNAAAAQNAAIASAATTALTLANAAGIQSPSTGTFVSTALPTLPSSSYAAGSCWITTDAKEYQVSADGKSWKSVAFYASAVIGQLCASQIVVANYDNLIPNPTSDQTPPTGGWPTGAFEAVGLQPRSIAGSARSGNNIRYYVQGTTVDAGGLYLTTDIPCSPGDQFYFEFWVWNLSVGSAIIYPYILFFDANGNRLGAAMTPYTCQDGRYSKASVTGTAPAGTSFCLFHINAPIGAGSFAIDDLYARRMCDANLIVDGSISASKLVVGAAVADIETVGSLTASVIYFTDGFCLNTLEPKEAGANVTSAHVLTASAALSSSVSTPASLSSAWTTATGFGWTVAASAAADVYNISGCLSLSCPSTPTTSNYFDVGISIDGADPTVYMRYYSQQTSSAQRQVVPMVQSITGLAAGSHSLTVAFRSDGTSRWTMQNTGSSALCQRIY